MHVRRLQAFSVAALLGCGLLHAQTPAATGSVSGTVRQTNGDVIPGATITVKVGGRQKTTVSNQQGAWAVDGLEPGAASVSARLSGFVSRRTQVQIARGSTAQWHVTLRPGQIFRPALETAGPDPTDPVLASSVYSVVLRRMIQGSVQKPNVFATSLVVPYVEEEWPEGLTVVPEDVRRAAAAPDAQRAVTLRAESLPPNARLIDRHARLDAPAASLSRVFFSEDHLGALVIFEQSCPYHCGRGELLWLQRKSVTDKWKVHTAFRLWTE